VRNFAPAKVEAVNTTRRTQFIPAICAAALAVGALAACSSSGGGSGSGSKLSKADFITQADAQCASTLKQVNAIPSPTGPTDYDAILKSDKFAETAEPALLKTLSDLADRTDDSAALHKNWLDVDTADFAAQKAFLVKFDAAATAKDSAQLTTLANQASAVPDHSADSAKYLTSYGLKDCASLESSGN
jgi:hypothetical protein